MPGLQLRRKMPACFGDDLDAAFHKPLALPVRFERFERGVAEDTSNAFDRFEHIGQSGNERTGSH